jgi:ribosome-associated toxin RatA of RatAB toxin-antitoxin module
VRRSLLLLPILLLAAPALSSSSDPTVWTVTTDGKGEVRSAAFEVRDADCAYSMIAEPALMEKYIDFVDKAEVHDRKGGFQHVTLTERFFPVGIVQSRYHRQVDGNAVVTWQLQEGRQKRHDGVWTVFPTDRGARVEFSNTIEAKSFLHQAILEAIQKRAMSSIVDAAISTCGVL